MADSFPALYAIPQETYRLKKVKVSPQLKKHFAMKGVPRNQLRNNYEKQEKLQMANHTVPILKRYELLREGEEKKRQHNTMQINNISYGKAWERERREICTRQKVACIALANGGSTRPVQHFSKGVDRDRYIEDLGVTVAQRCAFIKKMHIAKHHHRPKTSPMKTIEDVVLSKEELAREANLKKRAELPGNPHHDTFPTVFPVRSINMVTGGIPRSKRDV